MPTRRSFLISAAGIPALAPLSHAQLSGAQLSREQLTRAQQSDAAAFRLSAADDAFLDDISHRSFRYFWEQSDPKSNT